VGAVEHLKTLCCLGLPAESAMIAVTPLLHEIIPHGWTRIGLVRPDATVGSAYLEHPGGAALFRERIWSFMNDSKSPLSLWLPGIHAVGIGWTLHMQGQGWLEGGWYKEIEGPLDSCWMLDSMIGDEGRTIAHLALTRPRSARPFTDDDVQRLDRLRPWLAYAFRGRAKASEAEEDQSLWRTAGAPVLSGQMIFTAEEKILFQTANVEQLLLVLAGEPGDFTRHVLPRDRLAAPILRLLQCLKGAAHGESRAPPCARVSTPYGVVALEAQWLMPSGAHPADVAKDSRGCLIVVTIELRELAPAHAARVLRESGLTPAQLKVGIGLALGKSRPAVAEELDLAPSTVADLTRKLYQTLDVHSAAELSAKVWRAEQKPVFTERQHIFN
jgi:DNA-binding CsgD family transcriptional regulator